MKKQDIIDAINIEIEYFTGTHALGYIEGLKKAKEIINRLDQGEIKFAKDISTTNFGKKENMYTNILVVKKK